MRPTTLVGRSPLWTLQDDYSLVELVNERGTGKWKAKLEDLQNNKHVCTRVTTKEQLRERLKLLAGCKKGSKGDPVKYPYSADFPATPYQASEEQKAAAATFSSTEEREKYSPTQRQSMPMKKDTLQKCGSSFAKLASESWRACGYLRGSWNCRGS